MVEPSGRKPGELKAPNDTHRHCIFGRTGSGKTVAALWWLQRRSYDRMPWIVFDWKCDENIEKISHAMDLKVTADPPKRPGIYVVRPLPEVDDKAVDEMMWKILDRGRTGVYVDEGYMISMYNKAYRALLTQGRSKRIPIITLSQAPAHISPFILRESEFIQCFHLQTPNDIKRMAEYMPGVNVSNLEQYHSVYWDVAANRTAFLAPVPPVDTIMARFDAKRPPRGWRI
jgi:hypothetical protein